MRDFPVTPPFFGDLPVGSVVAFAGNLGSPASIPAEGSGNVPLTSSPPQTCVTDNLEAWGWMLCDGRRLHCGLYPLLFAVLGYQYGGNAKYFNIPDYRGYFLRGLNGGSDKDPGADTRKPPPGGKGPGEVGSTQPDSLKFHRHQYGTAPSPAAPSNTGQADGATTSTLAYTVGTYPAEDSHVSDVNAEETRPINIYVNYIIKFTYALKPCFTNTRGNINEL